MFIKSIRALTLLFAGLAIVFHMIIPHDHHPAVPAGGIKESCGQTHEKPDRRPLHPAHCYTLNDLAAEKFSPVNIRLVAQTSYASVIWHPEYTLPGLNLYATVFEYTGKFFPDISVPDFSPFRAPPLMS